LKKIIINIIILTALTVCAVAQNISEKGVPLIKNYAPADYNNMGKVWGITSTPNGIIYMAADKGLLEFDGTTWKNFKGSVGFTRALLAENDSVIYTGSDLDFGVWKKNKYQEFEYTSLYPFQKEINEKNEEFWNIHKLNENIIFVSAYNIYILKNKQLTKIAAPSKFIGNFVLDDSLYFADEKNGLYVLNEFTLKHLFNSPTDEIFYISGIYNSSEGIGIVTKNNGLYLYNNGILTAINNFLSENLKSNKVFSFQNINDTYLAFGTILNGLFITDINGNILHHINKSKGLSNNTILCLHYSDYGKLWLGTDYGISELNLLNNITYIYDYQGNFGTAYAALLHDQIFYFGTNQGLYFTKWTELNDDKDFNKFELIPNTEGQVWTLQKIDNEIYVGHDLGLLLLKDNSVQKICEEKGVWTILKYRDFLLTGNYNGICIFKKEENKWIFWKKMELILGSCNQLIPQNENILWINIPNYAFIRAELDSNLLPTDRKIFPVDIFAGNNPIIKKMNDTMEVFTDSNIYKFNETAKIFEKTNQTPTHQNIASLIDGIYQNIPLNSEYEFFPIYNGFALKYLKNKEKKSPPNYSITLRKIQAFNNEENITFYQNATIPYRLHNLNIECIVANTENVLYQYKLNDSEEWSTWSKNNYFEFLGLKQGQHILYIKANVNGKITDEFTVSFCIESPWYKAWYAYLVYFLLIISVIYTIRLWQKDTLKKQRQLLLIQEQNALRLQAEKHEQEILHLEQERMQAEYNLPKQQLKSKTIELANKAKDNEDKNKLLLTLKEKCEIAQNNPPLSKMKWSEMQRLLDSYLKVEDKTFEIQMDELHQEFFKKLHELHPSLSNNDLRMCAYLKIGLNSKEIAELLNILPSSFYISRSRLRKKLNLKVDEELTTFLNSII